MDEKKIEILERASQVYMKLGIKSVTMEDLARELGISKKTIYKYFEDKNDLVYTIIAHKIKIEQEICSKCAKEAENAIDDMLTATQFIIENVGNINPAVFHDLQRHHADAWQIIHNHKWEFVLRTITENIHRGIKEGLYRKDLNVPIVSRLYVASIDLIINTELFQWPEFKFHELFTEMMKFQLNGMVNDKGRELLKDMI